MKLFAFILALLSLPLVTNATGVNNFYPPNIVGVNPQQSGLVLITNAVPGIYSFTNSFPYPFISTPAMTFYVNSAVAQVNILTNTITSTNFVVTSGNTNCTISWTANLPYARAQTGIDGLGSFVSTAVSVTNNFPIPFTQTPVINVQGNGALYATNAGVWATATTTNLIITTGNTNQVIYWGAFGTAAAPGYNVVNFLFYGWDHSSRRSPASFA